jgi:hypothetical protein
MQITAPMLNVFLTDEELQLLAQVAKAPVFPGLSIPSPDVASNANYLQGLAYADKSLRARGLVGREASGQYAVDQALMAGVLVCARPTRSLLVQHFATPTAKALNYYGHINGKATVAHTMPEDGLHLISLLEEPKQLIAQISQLLQLDSVEAKTEVNFTINADSLALARAKATQLDSVGATEILATASNLPEVAKAIAALLASPYRNTVIVGVVHGAGDADKAIEKTSTTLLHDATVLWLIWLETQGPNQVYRFQSCGKTDLENLLEAWLGITIVN